MEELKAAAQRAQMLRSNRHGTYEDIMDEKELLKLTTSDEQVVVHFYHKEFRRCKIMDKHLSLLAPVHIEARFVKIDVDRCPFIVERLKIQVLPCVIMFVKSIAVDRIIGFEDIPGGDSCQTSYIAQRLANGSK
ncbi:hypothetical protein CXG81DRAFT_10915 [Caulochytrium protostelioides]|uniref:Thioredoxin-like protein n=1 Tax=Caulochytrium protostelioides TaxID=1555241 RepID=A0A4P9WWK6_9FUNG|nr:thioredoxin-like protein [Caulochytrium protostelioides]RKP02340.1 hypothetical protein CXG81DRAFT_10915 [Caulochytrium protostelioides]|eukprot:RKP02340.1 hypothetical protein CXG81DRAFT_10915 [Caulochytrium protostelioides]